MANFGKVPPLVVVDSGEFRQSVTARCIIKSRISANYYRCFSINGEFRQSATARCSILWRFSSVTPLVVVDSGEFRQTSTAGLVEMANFGKVPTLVVVDNGEFRQSPTARSSGAWTFARSLHALPHLFKSLTILH
jgi:hypothetical protein